MHIRINNLHTKVEPTGRDLLMGDIHAELNNFFKVKNKNSFWMRKKGWDGSTAFYSKKGQILTGLLPNVLKFIETEWPDMPIEFIDERVNLPKLPLDMRLKMNVVDSFGEYQLRDNQIAAMHKLTGNFINNELYWPRGICDAATNFGKNLIIASLYLSYNKKTLMLLHDLDIFHQACEFFGDLFGDIGIVGGGKCEVKDFTVAMYKTLKNRLAKSVNIRHDLADVFTLIVDESHRASGRDYTNLLRNINAGARFMVSGTPLDMPDPIKKVRLIGLSGRVLYKETNEDMMNKGHSLRPQVRIYLNGSGMRQEYESEKDAFDDAITDSADRPSIIASVLNEFPNYQTVINARYVRQAKKMYAQLMAKGFNARVLTGSSKNRQELIDGFRRGESRVLVTTILEAGMNMPIDMLIYARGGKSKIKSKQYLGRLLRKAGNTETPMLIDFFDNANYLDKHSRARIKILKKEGLDVKMMYQCNQWGTPKLIV